METLVLKKYLNRKIYNTESSSYITLPEVVKVLKSGRQVIVVDNKTKTDVTEAVLKQCLMHISLTEKDIIDIITKED